MLARPATIARPTAVTVTVTALTRLSLPLAMLACLSVPPVVACGPDEPARVPQPMKLEGEGDASAASSGLVATPILSASVAGAVTPSTAPNALDAGSAPARVTYPAPKPLTIPLARGDGAPLDVELKAGDVAMESQNFPAAEAAYKRAEALAPRDLAPKVGRARARVAKAAPDFGFASAKDNRDVRAGVAELAKIAATPAAQAYGPVFAELGRGELLLGDAPAALTHLAKAAELMPDQPEVLSAYGVAELASGNAENALARLKRGVELDTGSAPRHGNLGTVLFMLGRVKEAIAEYEIEVSIDDSVPRAHSDLGTALLAANDMNRGVAELRRAVVLEPGRATFHSNLGYALQLGGQREPAIAEYRKAIELDPKLVSARVNLATVLAHDPSTRVEARALLMTAKKLDPQDPRVQANLDELDALEKGQILH